MPNNTFDENIPELRNANYRKTEFKEFARGILHNDRYSRKAGLSVDTGGAIARAMEMAYKLGLAHGNTNSAAHHNTTPIQNTALSNEPIRWHSIPSRSRSIFDSIIRFKWLVLFQENVEPWAKVPDKWGCYWDWQERKPPEDRYELARTFSLSTLAVLVKLGLFDDKSSDGVRMLIPTQKGFNTWLAAVDENLIRQPDDGEFCFDQDTEEVANIDP